MEEEKGKQARSRKNSKSELNDFRQEFEMIKEELKNVRESYLSPILQSNERIQEQLRSMEDQVNKNTAAIELCQNQIDELRDAAAVSHTCPTEKMAGLQEVVKEAKLQIKNSKQLFVTKIENEAKLKEMLDGILGRAAKIEQIIDLGRNKDDVEQSEPGPFIVELENDGERENIMKRKAKFLKNTGAPTGINRARTKKERDDWKRKEGRKDTEEGKKSEGKKKKDDNCRYAEKCSRKDCKFQHPDPLRQNQQNINDKEVFHDATAFEDESDGGHADRNGGKSTVNGGSGVIQTSQ